MQISLPRLAAISCALTALVTSSLPVSAQTLKAIKERGTLICGVSQGVLGFSTRSDGGEWTGMDVDFCRALAGTIFDDASKVTFVPLSATERFPALQANKIDVLSRNSTWTMGRETELGLLFAGVTYYDGQGLMVRRARKVTSALELNGVKVCVQTGTTTELNVKDYFEANGMAYEATATATADDAIKAYDAGRCDVLTADASALHGERFKTSAPDDHDILPEIISKEPLGPVVRNDDTQWFNIVRWTHFAMLNAEELGVSSETLDEAMKSEKPDVRRLLGVEGSFGEQVGLTKDWVVRIVRHVGNYAEVYDRNVGVKTKIGIPRGINQLWTNGGILYAPPIR